MSGDDWEPERGRDRPPLVEYLVVGVAALVVVVVTWLGFADTRHGPTVSLTTTSIVTESTSVESDSLAVAWELAGRAGIRCDEDDGRDLALEVCDYRGDWVSVRVFPDGEQDAVLDWAESMVEQFGSDVLVGDGWGIEYLFSPGSDGRLGEVRAALGEGEIVASRRVRPPVVVMGGPLLDWRRVMDLNEDQDFASVLAAESGVWAVAGDEQEPSVLWYSADGLVWEELDTAGLLGEGAVVAMLVEGGPGLVAVGLRPVGGTREAVAWTSTDGRDWAVSPLGYTIPEPERPFEVTGLYFGQVAAGPLGAVVAASVWEGFDHEELERDVQAALPEGLREYRITIDLWEVSVSVGPFRVFSEWPSNLDIDQDLFDLYEQSMMSHGSSDSILFVTGDYESWRRVDEWPGEDEDAQVGAMTATPDGFLAFAGRWGWGFEPDGLYSSTDGITWQQTESPPDPGNIPWFGTHRGRLLMAGGLGWDPVLWESADGGTTWTAGAALPADAWNVRAGGLGLVAWGEHPSLSWYATSGGPTVVESDGYTMTVGEEHVSISDTHGDTVLTADLPDGDYWGGLELPEFIVADHQRGLFTVVDPDSGETLMTVTYREMEDAYENAEERPEVDPASFVAYSADREVWSEQAIPEITGVSGWPSLLTVGDDLAVMMIDGSDNGRSLWRGTAVSAQWGTVTVTPVQWGITPNDQGPGIHTVFMIVDVRPQTVDRVEDVSGRLIWDETVVDLCGIGIRDVGDGFLLVGDIFQTSEGCWDNPTAMREAFDEFGLPETACVTVRFGGVDHEYCAPLR